MSRMHDDFWNELSWLLSWFKMAARAALSLYMCWQQLVQLPLLPTLLDEATTSSGIPSVAIRHCMSRARMVLHLSLQPHHVPCLIGIRGQLYLYLSVHQQCLCVSMEAAMA
jgi:hypothetical protein